jgi:hypothetical protein
MLWRRKTELAGWCWVDSDLGRALRFLVWVSGKIGAVEGRVERPEVTREQ